MTFKHPDCIVRFSSSSTFGHTFQQPVISAEVQVNAPMTRQALKCDIGMHRLHFCNAANGWWQEEHAWVIGHC
jgi:hypothetical protein